MQAVHHQLRAFFIALSLLLAGSAGAQPFSQGDRNVSVFLGNGQAFNQTYTIFGVGIGYYALDGLELGLEYEDWSNAAPHIYKVTPSLRLVLNTGIGVRPYLGAFYRRVYTQGFPNLDAWGARAGVFFAAGRHQYAGAGIVYTRIRDCNQAVYQTCSDTYPELSFGFSI